MNKDLPREEQMRIVLQNYDRKQEECEALKKENESLKKQLERKDILYKNMVKTLTEKNEGEANSEKKWEHEYKILKNMYAQRGEKVNAQNTKIGKLTADLRTSKAEIGHLLKSLRDVITQVGNTHAMLSTCCAKAQGYLSSGISSTPEAATSSPQPATETQETKFVCYIRELIAIYRSTCTLRGISVLASKYGVSSLTKEQFFRFGFDGEGDISDSDILSAYPQAKKH